MDNEVVELVGTSGTSAVGHRQLMTPSALKRPTELDISSSVNQYSRFSDFL